MPNAEERLFILETKMTHVEENIADLKEANKNIATRLDKNEKAIIEIKTDTDYIRKIVDKLDERAEKEAEENRQDIKNFKVKCLGIGLLGGGGTVGIVELISKLFF